MDTGYITWHNVDHVPSPGEYVIGTIDRGEDSSDDVELCRVVEIGAPERPPLPSGQTIGANNMSGNENSGRKPKRESEKMIHVLPPIRVTKGAAKWIRKAAEDMGETPTEFCRRAVLERAGIRDG